MLNIHTKHKQDQQKEYLSQEHAKLVRHRRRLDQFRTNALKACETRVVAFIDKMSKNPIEVGDDHDANWRFLRLFREPEQHHKNISEDRFKLRDELDWQSLLTPMQRAQRKSEQKKGLRFLSKAGLSRSLLNRDCTSQQPYDDRKQHIFRDNHSEKDIHRHPMIFANHRESTPKRALSVQSKPYKAESVGCIPCKRAEHETARIQRNLQDEITERKTIILSATMKHKPKSKIDSMTIRSTGTTFRPKKAHQIEVPEEPIEMDQFMDGKKKWDKIYFKDMVEIANIPKHRLHEKAKDALVACNLYRYKNPDF